MEETISINKLISLMLSKIWFIILSAVLFGAAAFSISEFLLPVKYQSYTSLYVKNGNQVTDQNNVNIGDLNAAKSLAATYIVVLKDDAVMLELSDRILAKYGEDGASRYFRISDRPEGGKYITPSALRSIIQMNSVDATEVIRITTTTTSAEVSADICNLMADIAPGFIVRVVGAGSVEAVGDARINKTPVSPNKKKNTAVGFLLGGVLAAAIVFLIDFFDNTVKDKEILYDKFKKAIIGEIQSFDNDKKKKKNKKKSQKEIEREARNTLLNKDTPFYITESYKAMRTNLMFALSTTDKKIIAVSSPLPGEGKSTTAANLAIGLAQADKKVLLIDGDMRKPVQHRTFGLKNKTGLSSVLGKMNSLEDCIQKTKAANLDLLASGPKPPNPSELLASVQTGTLLNEVSEKYDYVVIDTPPVNVVSDAMGLNSYIAGILLVIRYAVSTFEEVENSMNIMNLADSNILGFVINEIDGKGATYHSYKYKYKSKYGYYKSSYGYSYGYGGYGYGYGYSDSDKDEEKSEARQIEKKSEEKKSEDKKPAEKKTEEKKSSEKKASSSKDSDKSEKRKKK